MRLKLIPRRVMGSEATQPSVLFVQAVFLQNFCRGKTRRRQRRRQRMRGGMAGARRFRQFTPTGAKAIQRHLQCKHTRRPAGTVWDCHANKPRKGQKQYNATCNISKPHRPQISDGSPNKLGQGQKQYNAMYNISCPRRQRQVAVARRVAASTSGWACAAGDVFY